MDFHFYLPFGTKMASVYGKACSSRTNSHHTQIQGGISHGKNERESAIQRNFDEDQ